MATNALPRMEASHRHVDLNGLKIFYREAGPRDAPALLLPHGYPCSSYQYRRLLPALADRWHLLAPDYPGFGYSDTPDPSAFGYDFDAYATFLDRFAASQGLKRYALYLHDYGSQIGLRLAIRAPERVTALIVQNGDIHEDALGPKYAAIKRYWNDPSPAVQLMEGLKANLAWFPKYQRYLREHRPPTLIVWGPRDGYMPEASARAYLRDLPDAELHLTDGGHWLLESHFDEVLPIIRNFLDRVHSAAR